MDVIDQTQLLPLINTLMEKNNVNPTDLSKILLVSQQYIDKVIKSPEGMYVKAKVKILNALGVNAVFEKEPKIYIDGYR